VADAQVDRLADTQAAGVDGAEQHPRRGMAKGVEEAMRVGRRQDDGQGLGAFAVGDLLDHLGFATGGGKEETQGTDGLVEGAPGDVLAEQMQLEVADVRGAELVGGSGRSAWRNGPRDKRRFRWSL